MPPSQGELKDLSAYKNTGGTNVSKEILIVAGAGGGNDDASIRTAGRGGHGGGYIGNNGDYHASHFSYGTGGTQSNAGSMRDSIYSTSCSIDTVAGFGQGGIGHYGTDTGGGGGSGWYGGGDSCTAGQGGGGSGYIGSSNLVSGGGITKHMTCYTCATSTVASTYTVSTTNMSATATADYAKTGNGYAKITYIGTTI